jgi:hypothetical protein
LYKSKEFIKNNLLHLKTLHKMKKMNNARKSLKINLRVNLKSPVIYYQNKKFGGNLREEGCLEKEEELIIIARIRILVLMNMNQSLKKVISQILSSKHLT